MAKRGGPQAGALPYLLIAPAMLVMAVVVFYPFLYNFQIAFSNMSLYTFRNPAWAGFRHFKEIFTTAPLYGIFLKTCIWTIVNVFFHVTIGLFLAVLLNGPVRGRSIYRAFLMLAGEWMPLTLFKNQQGKLSNATKGSGLENFPGWWDSLVGADL